MSGRSTGAQAESLADLSHRAVLDSSAWPALVMSLLTAADMPEEADTAALDTAAVSEVLRAQKVTETILDLRELNARQSRILQTTRLDVYLLDQDDQPIYVSRQAPTGTSQWDMGDDTADLRLMRELGRRCREGDTTVQEMASDGDRAYVAMTRAEAVRAGFSGDADVVIIGYTPPKLSDLEAFGLRAGLPQAQRRFLSSFVSATSVRQAADRVGVTYETARSYLKNIYRVLDVNTQTELIKLVLTDPNEALFGRDGPAPQADDVRKLLRMPDGRTVEYFRLGPAEGYPVFFFDAFSGIALDLIGRPERYLPYLNRLSIQVVTVCRPGNFRSSMRELESLSELAADILAVADQLNLQRISLLSYSYGVHHALSMAAALPDRVDRLVISSGSFQPYNQKHWRQLDPCSQIIHTLGRIAPVWSAASSPFWCDHPS